MAIAQRSKMKESGTEWIGEIPEHWSCARTRLVARLESGHTPSRNHPEYWVNCNVPWFTLADVWQLRDGSQKYVHDTKELVSELGLANSSARLLPKDTVILSRTASVGFSAIMGVPMATTQDFVNWVCGPRIVPPFLLWVFRGMKQEFERLMMGSTHKTIYMPDAEQFSTPLPPLPEQRVIAAFLDRKTAQIDAVVAKKQRLIERLQEKRQALISHAVTKGLDPHAPMKDSGISWIGSVPRHWDVERIKWVAKMESGHTPDKKVEAYWTDCDIPWVSLNDSKYLKINDYITDTAYYVNELGIANSSARLLRERAVVFSRDATIGLCAITTRPMAVSQHFIAWLCGRRIRPEFLLRVFDSMTEELDRLTFGATLKTIGMPDVRMLVTPVPPLEEQDAIVERIQRHNDATDRAIDSIHMQIAKLQEYRQTLITAAVTGKIDVTKEAVC